MSKVIENLYIGSYEDATDQAAIDGQSITHIVNCTANLKDVFDHVTYRRVPLEDIPYASLADFLDDALYEYMDSVLSTPGKRLLVHCQYGISRCSTIVTFYLMRKRNETFEKAYAFLLERRPMAFPDYTYRRYLISLKK